MSQPLINGQYRNYASVRVNLLGRTVIGVAAINYKTADAIDPVKVVGSKKAMGFTQGDETNEGSITFYSEELDGIQNGLPAGYSIKDIPPFPITVSYVNNSGLQVAHKLMGCKFKENGRSAESGSNDALSQEIPLYIHDIDWNA